MCKIILLSDFAEEYGKNLLRGIARYSKDHGPWTFCRMPGYYRDTIGIDGIVAWAKEWKADGIIGQFYNHEEVARLKRAGIPVIAQDFKERFDNIPNITGDSACTFNLTPGYTAVDCRLWTVDHSITIVYIKIVRKNLSHFFKTRSNGLSGGEEPGV